MYNLRISSLHVNSAPISRPVGRGRYCVHSRSAQSHKFLKVEPSFNSRILILCSRTYTISRFEGGGGDRRGYLTECGAISCVMLSSRICKKITISLLGSLLQIPIMFMTNDLYTIKYIVRRLQKPQVLIFCLHLNKYFDTGQYTKNFFGRFHFCFCFFFNFCCSYRKHSALNTQI